MISRLCHTLLARAARRWPVDLRAAMLAEWQAELHVLPTTAQRLRYAASLATSRPHREGAVLISPQRAVAHGLLWLALITVLPTVYLPLALNWTSGMDPGTVVWQTWVAGGSVVAAAVLGAVCGSLTTGVTRVIEPMSVARWTVGVGYVTVVAYYLVGGGLDGAMLTDMTYWALSAVALCTLAAKVAGAGWRLLSWVIVVIAVPVTFWFAHLHSALSDFSALGMEYFFGGEYLPAFLFAVGKQELLHVIIFLFVYAHVLVLRHRAAPVAEASQEVAA
ncbi:hypothetical protein Cme02nite_05060 [Catellatospora methionotrophica]|uniref:Uncharacterized protein n=1 Tax=Catellatospora methionotrophica TaxID=121620 RepID=A0A8J3LAM2_9ACTN|nr:hypothetical protein [Catellatospora methionotrophica]GIG12174.1 hypothetical protein Cme02nite_05060 [Catellatospora methionotrophica]